MMGEYDFRVTLLGTGVPTPRADRFGPSTLIEAGSRKLLIDAGRGATIRLNQLGIPIGPPKRFARLLNHYDLTEPARRGGGTRMLRVADALINELLEGLERE